MAIKPETKFKNKIRPLLENLPNTAIFKIQQISIRGVPDFLLCVNSKFVALELKKSCKDKPTPLQSHILDKIQLAGGEAYVVCPENWESVFRTLTRIAIEGI